MSSESHENSKRNILKEYEDFVSTTESGSVQEMTHNERLMYFALGFCGEAGEVGEKIKKLVRDNNGTIQSSLEFGKLCQELSDPLWYLQQLCNELSSTKPSLFHVSLVDLFKINIAKLKGRLRRGTIQGSGDNR